MSKKQTDIVLEDENDDETTVEVSNPMGIQGIQAVSESPHPPPRRPSSSYQKRPTSNNSNGNTVIHVEKQHRPQRQQQQTHAFRDRGNGFSDDDEDDNFDEMGIEMLANPRKILSKGMRNQSLINDEDDDNDNDDRPPTQPQPDMPDLYDAVGNQAGPHGFGQIPVNHRLRSQTNIPTSGGYLDDEDDDEDVEDEEDDESDMSETGSIDSELRGPPPKQMSYSDQQRRKRYLLSEFRKFERRGITVPRHLDMSSTLDDLELEYSSIKRQIDLQKSIRFQRRMLMACVTGIEFLNHRYDPFNVHLDGWSENVMEDIHDYDDVFEELYDKYHEKVQVAPELRLMFMIGGSAFWYHLSHTMFQSAFPDMRQNPEFMENMTRAAASAMKAAAAQQQQQQGGGGPQRGFFGGIPPPMSTGPDIRRDMRPPSNNVVDILNRMGSMGANAPSATVGSGGGLHGAPLETEEELQRSTGNNNNTFGELDLSDTDANDNVKNITVRRPRKK